jgi:hypothetical protein
MSDEYMDLMYGMHYSCHRLNQHTEYLHNLTEMWNGAYADDAQVWDTVNNIAYEPSKTRKLKFEGKYFAFEGLPQTIPSPVSFIPPPQ